MMILYNIVNVPSATDLYTQEQCFVLLCVCVNICITTINEMKVAVGKEESRLKEEIGDEDCKVVAV